MRLDGDDWRIVCTHCRGLVRRSCLVGMSCGEAEVVVVTGRRPCCETARAQRGSSAYASLRGSDVLLGGSFRCEGQVCNPAARAASAADTDRSGGELVFFKVCTRARGLKMWADTK